MASIGISYVNGSVFSNDNVTSSTNATELFPANVAEKGVTNIDDYLWVYVSPFIFVFGVCGNALTLAVMRRKKLCGTTTSVYLPVMAVFDTIALTFGVGSEWFKACGIVEFRELHPFVCKLGKFSFYTSSDVAIWVLVLFTVDRFVAVSFPLQKTRICVPRRAKIGCAVVFVCAVIKNVHVFWTRGAEFDGEGNLVSNCGRPQPFTSFENMYRPWIAFALISLVPFCIVLSSNSVIVWTLARSRYAAVRKVSRDTERVRVFKQTTMMCLSVSVVFLVCVFPSIVLLIGKPYWTTPIPTFGYEVAKAVNNQLAYINHSINFFLYCLTGQKFRTELVSMFTEVRQSIHLGTEDSSYFSSHQLDGRRTASVPTVLRTINHHIVDPFRHSPKNQACSL